MLACRPMEWMEHAACQNADSNIFFDDEALAAKRVCYHCPSRQPCLLYACEHDLVGVWGGYTEEERAKLTLRQNLADGRIRIVYEDL